MEKRDVVVVGGGVSGLSLAHALAAAGREVLVLERSERIGGCVRSHRSGGFWFEMGAHTAYNSYGGFIAIAEAMGLRDKLVPRAKVPFRLLQDGALKSVFSELSFFEAMVSVPRAFATKKSELSVQGYYERILGKGNYARLLRPFFAAVPSQLADAFPATMLFKKRPRRKDVLRSFTVDGGLQSVLDAVTKAKGVSVETGREVSRIVAADGGFRVELTGGEVIEATHVAVAVPPHRAAKLLAELAPDASRALGEIHTVRVESVGVVVPVAKVSVPPVAGIVPRDDIFYSAVSRDTVPDATHRAFTFHFKPESEPAARLERIAEVLRVSRDDLEEVVEGAVELPSPRLGHADIVARIDAALVGQRFSVVGNYFGGLALEDCVERASREAERLLALGSAA